ncbi:MAG: U32 family peptidase [Oscillospiraceae bacterium]|nr:U32 family peptidase [Oscillospiraceae bacterium]
MSNIEILAPAGSGEALRSAVLSGADAVYLGVGNFNARRNAQNFTSEQLKSAIEYCHSRGVKVHVTLNTLIKDSELSAVYDDIKSLCSMGADALIIQDMGVARAVREICPDIEMHASTQMSTGTLRGLFLLKQMGFSRAVLPRELSRNEIKYLCENSPIELEMFIHGALCMCVSGQCLMSAMLGSRSGNRGLCAQPCRLPFKAENGTGHDLSLKDLSIIENIPELSLMGISSFKIEGRMKRPEYVCAAVKACRAAADSEYIYETEKDLEALFSRSGFTDGYYKSKTGRTMFGFREKENVQSATKELFVKYSSIYTKETPRFKVNFTFHGKIGEKAELTAQCKGFKATVYSDTMCETPINRPLSAERIIDALSKCGGTQFFADSAVIDGDIEFTLPISSLNAMRRSALAQLEQQIIGEKTLSLFPSPVPTDISSRGTHTFYCRFDSVEQIPDNTDGMRIFIPLDTDENIIRENGYCVELPHGMLGNGDKVRKILSKTSADTALCHTLDAAAIALECGKKVVASPGVNILNSLSVDEAKRIGINEFTVSNECTLEQFGRISAPIPKGITVYGRIPLMLTRNCPVKNGKSCAECGRKSGITDRMGIEFPVRCAFGYSEILNSRPIYMADRLREIPPADFCLFNFTTESRAEIEEIINSYKTGNKPAGEFTRGLLYRGVE